MGPIANSRRAHGRYGCLRQGCNRLSPTLGADAGGVAESEVPAQVTVQGSRVATGITLRGTKEAVAGVTLAVALRVNRGANRGASPRQDNEEDRLLRRHVVRDRSVIGVHDGDEEVASEVTGREVDPTEGRKAEEAPS